MKQAIVVRTDLKMSKGKIAVQVAHASVSAALKVKRVTLKKWLTLGQKKVVLKVNSKKDLFKVIEKAKKQNVIFDLIRDAGLTEIPPGTETAVGLGPDEDKKIDKVIGDLPLLK